MAELSILKPLSEEETKIIRSLTKADATVTITIPPDIDVETFKQAVTVTCRELGRSQAQTSVLMPVLGRLLQVAQNNEEIMNSYKCNNYEGFVEMIGTKFGVGRSTCFEARKMVERWGEVAVKDFATIGRLKFKLISKAVSKGDEKSGAAKRLLEKAKDSTYDELMEYCEQKEYLKRSETVGASFIIHTSKSGAKKFKKFFETPEIQAWAESDQYDKILDALISSQMNEALIEGAAKIEETQKAEAQKSQRAAKEAEAS